ncbi:hypothetical protein DXG01_000162 [Tephrocybe rancida]|nr:hypothetical protein DXG01_000162 [Tephrocybe rancida]
MAYAPHSTYNALAQNEYRDNGIVHSYIENQYPNADQSPYYPVYSPTDNPHHWATQAAPYNVSYSSPPIGDSGTDRSSYMAPHCSGVHLHAPAPMSGQASSLLLPSVSEAYSSAPVNSVAVPLNQARLSSSSLSASACETTKSFSDPGLSATRPAPVTFPTPSAMLSELAANAARPPSLVAQSSDSKNETVRKTRRRAMAQSIGFVPTDPCAPTFGPISVPKSPLTEPTRDAISSHEKKRHYLECLEYYVTYLHQQLALVGCAPVRLQRPTTSGRGMNSQSIRTLLVHMENLTRRLNQEMMAEEQRVSFIFPMEVHNILTKDISIQFIHLRGIAEQSQGSERQTTALGN